MSLVRLIYCSTHSDSFKSTQSIDDILSTARTNNKTHYLTGILCFNRNYFLQCIEGRNTDVNDLYHSIANDKRHHTLLLLDYSEIQERTFSSWEMGYVPETKITDPINIRYSVDPRFNPYEMTGGAAYLMLKELHDTVPLL
ncbi:BLUF domain-containing protein [Algicola sagamiensis]|uniref:BLUF domain-containing protein n=1 Tax=Algicola sagamiensis TaxID=163869 RepID=UPI00037E80F8|nr:BLUF domain-containing protein [Algicola sagamiensis]